VGTSIAGQNKDYVTGIGHIFGRVEDRDSIFVTKLSRERADTPCADRHVGRTTGIGSHDLGARNVIAIVGVVQKIGEGCRMSCVEADHPYANDVGFSEHDPRAHDSGPYSWTRIVACPS